MSTRNSVVGFSSREQRRLYVATMLEMVAVARPDLLRHTVDVSDARGLADLAKLWGVEVEAMHDVALKVAKDLDRLEQRRLGWRDPGKMVFQPNTTALSMFASVRARRVDGIARRRRLEIIWRKVKRVADSEHNRRALAEFMSQPSTPVDVKEFLSRG